MVINHDMNKIVIEHTAILVLDHFFSGLLALYIYTMLLRSTTKATQIHEQYLALCHLQN